MVWLGRVSGCLVEVHGLGVIGSLELAVVGAVRLLRSGNYGWVQSILPWGVSQLSEKIAEGKTELWLDFSLFSNNLGFLSIHNIRKKCLSE